MITWEFESNEYSVINLPIRKQETDIDIQMEFSSDETLANVFLFTSSAYSGVVSAKKSTDSTYLNIEEYSTTPSCYLGDVEADTPITLDIKLNFSTAFSGEQVVPIYVGHGSDSEITPMYYSGINFFWLDNSTDDPFHWYDSTEEGDSDVWHSEY